MAGGNYQLILYQYNNGATGHVDVGLVGGSQLIAGFNAHGSPQQNSPLQSGWFDESSFYNQMEQQGYVFNKQTVLILSPGQYNTLYSYLTQQIAITKGMTISAGYSLLGNNCVDGVQTLFSMIGLNTHPVDYMKSNTTAVYMYAFAQKASYYIPPPVSSGLNFHSNLTAIGSIIGYIGSAGDYVINSAMNLVSSTGTQEDGTPYAPPTGSIVVTLNQSTHTASVDYSQMQDLNIYDQSGNLIGTEPSNDVVSIPQDVADAMIQSLQQLASDLDFANGIW